MAKNWPVGRQENLFFFQIIFTLYRNDIGRPEFKIILPCVEMIIVNLENKEKSRTCKQICTQSALKSSHGRLGGNTFLSKDCLSGT